MRIIKFEVGAGHNFINANAYLEPIWIEWQGGGFVVWCKEFTNMRSWDSPLGFYLAMTGEELPDSYTYIATATNPDRTLVVHLFQTPRHECWKFKTNHART